jgi:hypothetical protein
LAETLKNFHDTFLPKTKETIAKTKNTKNKILAMSMAEPAIPPNPSTAAIIAMIKNVTAQFNIVTSFLKLERLSNPATNTINELVTEGN